MPKKINLTGEVFGRLTVVEPAPNKNSKTQWKCRCECGNFYIGSTDSLRSGKLQSCGCLRKETAQKQAAKNVISLMGQKFGKLTVIQQAPSIRGHSAWVCECECGGRKTVSSTELKSGDTLSCGCLKSSYGETQIEGLLAINGIAFKKEYVFPDLKSENGVPLRFDFAIFDNNTLSHLIEYDGEQHYLPKGDNSIWSDNLEKRKKRDIQKNEYCQNNNIPLIRIPYWNKNRITIELLMKI